MKKKIINNVFGKTIFLLGQDDEGINYWLESPSWECNWYWGFGYVETYTNNNRPNLAKDINSHSHIGGYGDSNRNLKIWNILTKKTFSDNEEIELKKLFEKYYLLRKEADSYHNDEFRFKWKELNSVTIPEIMNKIISILTPENENAPNYSIQLVD